LLSLLLLIIIVTNYYCYNIIVIIIIVSVIILQKTGAGLHYDCASHWDTKTDGAVTSKFENDTIVAIITVFAIAL
jgi:hypothetical protein